MSEALEMGVLSSPILEKLVLSLSKGGMRAIQGFANVTCSLEEMPKDAFKIAQYL